MFQLKLRLKHYSIKQPKLEYRQFPVLPVRPLTLAIENFSILHRKCFSGFIAVGLLVGLNV